MAKECVNCVHKSDFKAVECGTCMVSYMDGLQHGLPSNFKPKPNTNADRIRAMSDEELAEDYCKTLLKVMQYFGIKNTGMLEDAVRVRLEWLKQPAEE